MEAKKAATSFSRQRVLAVPHEAMNGLYARQCFYHDHDSVQRVLRAVSQEGRWIDRVEAESNSALAQIVACAVVRCGDEVLCLRRSANAERKNLRLTYTMMIGGHVDDLDSDADFPAEACVRRELREELGIEIGSELSLLGVVVDPLSQSGWLHLGLIFDAPFENNSIEFDRSLDTEEFTGNSCRRVTSMMTLSDISALREKLDPWSRLFAQSAVWGNPIGFCESSEQTNQLLFPFVWDASRALE